MSFFEKHIFFPKRFGIAPYFWLVFLIPTIYSLFPLTSWFDWLFILLLVIFLKAYRDGYEVHKFLTGDVFLQLLIACLFGIFQKNGYLFIFVAWEIGSLPVTKRLFYHYLTGYYVSVMISLGAMLWTTRFTHSSSYINVGITIIAAIITPLAAKSVGESYRRIYRLNQQNKRLEAVVRQNERDRIARDLHDHLGQASSIISLKAELAEKLIAIDSRQATNELHDIAETSRKNLSLVRGIVSNLQERTIAQTMLEEEKNLVLTNIQLHSVGEELAEKWPTNIQHTVSAVIKEAITNMIRHSKASIAMIDFTENIDTYFITIQDNGQGFTQLKSTGYGISEMKERIQTEKGQLTITGTQGVKIVISLPKENEHD
ncbi:sensor histidine kinase [Enterococcus hirae]|nr:sensor histidine kinase [Enterococcus hirae]EMF0297278.1 sensor histidine kinase [Enterococcus hirae]